MYSEYPSYLTACVIDARSLVNNKFRLAACIIPRKGRSFIGFNDPGKTHPMCTFLSKGKTVVTGMHAEMAALAKAKSARTDLKNATIYVARTLRRDGSEALARPCPMCRAELRRHGIKKVVYTIAPFEYGVMML